MPGNKSGQPASCKEISTPSGRLPSKRTKYAGLAIQSVISVELQAQMFRRFGNSDYRHHMFLRPNYAQKAFLPMETPFFQVAIPTEKEIIDTFFYKGNLVHVASVLRTLWRVRCPIIFVLPASAPHSHTVSTNTSCSSRSLPALYARCLC